MRLCSRLRIPAFDEWVASCAVRVERPDVVVLPPAPPPPERGSFRQLFDGGGSAS